MLHRQVLNCQHWPQRNRRTLSFGWGICLGQHDSTDLSRRVHKGQISIRRTRGVAHLPSLKGGNVLVRNVVS